MTARTGTEGQRVWKKTAEAGAAALNLFLYLISSTFFPLRRAHPQPVPQSPQLPVVAVSNSIVLPGTEANGVINYLLSAGLSSECDQYPSCHSGQSACAAPAPPPITVAQQDLGPHLIVEQG